MAESARPFTAFNFRVELSFSDREELLCTATFSECDGLEMTMEPKTIQEGGNNTQAIHRIGPVTYGQLSLKRGMTETFALWNWFDEVMQLNGSKRASGEVVLLAADGETEQVRFELTGCLPLKLKAPALNAGSGILAIEEMQIAYETLHLKRPGS